jgi:hypothetical protein
VERPSAETSQLQAAVSPQVVGLVLRMAEQRLHELDSCPLRLPDGDTVEVVTVPEIRDWLEGMVARSRAGERL